MMTSNDDDNAFRRLAEVGWLNERGAAKLEQADGTKSTPPPMSQSEETIYQKATEIAGHRLTLGIGKTDSISDLRPPLIMRGALEGALNERGACEFDKLYKDVQAYEKLIKIEPPLGREAASHLRAIHSTYGLPEPTTTPKPRKQIEMD